VRLKGAPGISCARCSLPLRWLQVWLELLGHTDAKYLPLEPVLGRKLAKVPHVQRGEPRHVGQAQLPPHGVHLVVHVGVARVAAGVVGDLPATVPGKTGFEQELLVFTQRQELADAPLVSDNGRTG
jgi:hypothetical protein